MKTILVVDDFASVRFYHERLLRQAGYATLPATDGAEALLTLEKCPVDLVMLDLMMPKMNGTEFMTRIRSTPRFAAIPVLLITSEANHELADSFRGSTHCSVLKKPILPQALTEAVHRLIGETVAR